MLQPTSVTWNAGQDLLVQCCKGLEQFKRTFAWRVHQPFVGSAVFRKHLRCHLEQVPGSEPGRCQGLSSSRRRFVPCVVVTRARDQRFTALHAQNLTRPGSQWQSKVAQAAKPVDHALVRLHVEQAQGPSDQHAIDLWIDLREIGGPERHDDTEFGQFIGQVRGPSFLQQSHRFEAFGLQPPLHAGMLCSKVFQAGDIGLTERLQMAQHHGNHTQFIAAGRIATCQFDLWAGGTRIHRGDQLTQRHQHRADRFRQHRTHLHVGHITAFAFMKADQHDAFFNDVANRKTGSVAVVPSGALQRTQHGFGLDLAKMPQGVFHGPLLDRHLRRGIEVLHLATTACALVQAEVGTTWLDTLRRFTPHLAHDTLLPVVFVAQQLAANLFERQGTFDEDDFAVEFVGHALRFQIERLDLEPFVLRPWPGSGGGNYFFVFDVRHAPIVSGVHAGPDQRAGK